MKSAPLFDSNTMTAPSSNAGATHVADVEDLIEARTTLCPNLQSIPGRKLTPMTVTMHPPVLAPILGISAVAASAAVYSKEVETERSAPLIKTSSGTTAGEAAKGETQTTTFSEINVTEPERNVPNLQRMALSNTLYCYAGKASNCSV